MLSNNNSIHFQSTVLKSIQNLQNTITQSNIYFQQQINELTRQVAVITVRLNDNTQAVGGQVTKASLGLGNVNNTSDANKEVSIATNTALGYKQALIDDTHPIPISYVNTLSTALAAKASNDTLALTNTAVALKASSSDLTSAVSTLNTAINLKADTTALATTNTAVALKASSSDLTSAVSTLNASITTTNNAVALKASSSDLTSAVSTLNGTIATKTVAGDLIFDNIKTSSADTTTLTSALASKTGMADLIFANIKTSASIPTTLTTALASKQSINLPYEVTISSAVTSYSIPSSTLNKLLIFTNSGTIASSSATLPTIPTTGTLFNDGDFIHIVAVTNGSTGYSFTINKTGTTGAKTLSSTLTTTSCGVGALFRIVTISSIQRWICLN